VSPAAKRAIDDAAFALFPSPWGVRETISHDFTLLWPRQYTETLLRFRRSAADERARFLARTGVRYEVLPHPPLGEYRLLTRLDEYPPFALYEVREAAERVRMVEGAEVEPDLARQTERLFEAAFDPASAVLLERDPPPPSGTAGEALAPSARLLEERASSLVVEAEAGEGGGYLLLLDSFDPHWRAEVDGREADLLRADALFRAVRLAPGRHLVRFAYRPTPLLAGLALSALSALALAALALRRPARGAEARS
jgi:hypothetical protein